MKSLIFLGVVGLLISGCATIKKQQNIGKIMETHVFDAPPEEVYSAASTEFSAMFLKLEGDGKNSGASPWLIAHKEDKMTNKKWQEKDRFVVEISSNDGKKSKLTVHREAQSNFVGGKWGSITSGRMYIYEFNILKRMNPSLAQQIDAKAAKM